MAGHREIFEELRREILAGRYDAGRSLPSETALARRLGRCAERAGWDFIRGEIKGSDPKVRAREVRRLAYRFSKEHVAGVFFQPLDAIAETALQALVSRIKVPHLPPRTILLDVMLVPR